VSGYVTHLELHWKMPSFAPALREFSSFCRLIRFDKRGTGMSDPVSGAPTLETRMDDVRAVMDAIASRRAAFLEEVRFGSSPGALEALHRMNKEIDIRHVLPSVHVPTLVLHGALDTVVPLEVAQHVASRIPTARLVELSGIGHLALKRAREIVNEVRRFVTEVWESGGWEEAEPESVLATVLFTDLVGSTGTAAELGDRGWRELLEQHHTRIRAQLSRFRGVELDAAGDGFFARFDGPARAIRCACAIRGALAELGLEMRAGLHTGEFELMDEKVAGIAVSIGARVAAQDGPGEVLVSQTVRDLVAGSGLKFEDRGTAELKGVPRGVAALCRRRRGRLKLGTHRAQQVEEGGRRARRLSGVAAPNCDDRPPQRLAVGDGHYPKPPRPDLVGDGDRRQEGDAEPLLDHLLGRVDVVHLHLAQGNDPGLAEERARELVVARGPVEHDETLVREIGHLGAGGEPVFGIHREDELVLVERERLELGIVQGADQRHADLVPLDKLEHFLGMAGANRDLHVRMPLGETLEDRRQSVGGDGRGSADCNAAGDPPSELVHDSASLADCLERAFRVWEKCVPGFGELDPASVPNEQRESESRLEPLHSRGHCRLGQVQGLCCPPKRPQPRDLDECFQLPDQHRRERYTRLITGIRTTVLIYRSGAF
jgi:class 3 adenylate cyclase